MTAPTVLEDVLHRELNDPGSTRRSGCAAAPAVTVRVVIRRAAKDFPESISCAQGSCGISGPEAVGHVECFRAKFHPFSFGDLEFAGNRLIPFPESRTSNVALAPVPIGSLRRYRKRRRVEIVREGIAITIRVGEDLVGTLHGRTAREPVERLIVAEVHS